MTSFWGFWKFENAEQAEKCPRQAKRESYLPKGQKLKNIARPGGRRKHDKFFHGMNLNEVCGKRPLYKGGH